MYCFSWHCFPTQVIYTIFQIKYTMSEEESEKNRRRYEGFKRTQNIRRRQYAERKKQQRKGRKKQWWVFGWVEQDNYSIQTRGFWAYQATISGPLPNRYLYLQMYRTQRQKNISVVCKKNINALVSIITECVILSGSWNASEYPEKQKW